MPTLGKDYQAMVKDANTVLVGVAQVRVGLPSIRSAGTAITKALQFVGTSTMIADTSTGATINYLDPLDMSTGGTLPTGCTATVTGTYTGAYDGCFILRYNGTTWDIFSPAGYQDAAVTTASITSGKAMNILSATASGLTITGVMATTPTSGQTWIIPVWSGTAQNKNQTGIISPYSMFQGSNESVGGLKSATFTPKLESIKTLESGFPSLVADRVIEKISVECKFEALEYNNANIANLKNMVLQITQQFAIPALPVEVVMRTRGNNLVSFWIPNASLQSVPSYSPTNDYSSLSWELGATKSTEITGETAAYNTWLRNANIYEELTYLH